jgi:hypothetical protein
MHGTTDVNAFPIYLKKEKRNENTFDCLFGFCRPFHANGLSYRIGRQRSPLCLSAVVSRVTNLHAVQAAGSVARLVNTVHSHSAIICYLSLTYLCVWVKVT